MDKGKIRLGRFDKWGYKNSFSKGELARELVYTNEDNDNLKQALNKIREYVKDNLNINQLIQYDILQIIDKEVND